MQHHKRDTMPKRDIHDNGILAAGGYTIAAQSIHSYARFIPEYHACDRATEILCREHDIPAAGKIHTLRDNARRLHLQFLDL